MFTADDIWLSGGVKSPHYRPLGAKHLTQSGAPLHLTGKYVILML
jgi:hypothetical protein